MSEGYNGQAAERAERAKARWAANGGYPSKRAAALAKARKQLLEAQEAIRRALACLDNPTVNDNKFRMGIDAAKEVIQAIVELKRGI
jgi:coenzyme F420-reducing hydrogenase alpha subunit